MTDNKILRKSIRPLSTSVISVSMWDLQQVSQCNLMIEDMWEMGLLYNQRHFFYTIQEVLMTNVGRCCGPPTGFWSMQRQTEIEAMSFL